MTHANTATPAEYRRSAVRARNLAEELSLETERVILWGRDREMAGWALATYATRVADAELEPDLDDNSRGELVTTADAIGERLREHGDGIGLDPNETAISVSALQAFSRWCFEQ